MAIDPTFIITTGFNKRTKPGMHRIYKKETGTLVTTGYGVDGSTLLCPNCGEGYLHHEVVTVFDRREDEKQLTLTRVSCGMVASHLVPSADSGNPSQRRDGIAISFSCELCDADPIELTIAQHKGATFLGWRYAVPESRSENLTFKSKGE